MTDKSQEGQQGWDMGPPTPQTVGQKRRLIAILKLPPNHPMAQWVTRGMSPETIQTLKDTLSDKPETPWVTLTRQRLGYPD